MNAPRPTHASTSTPASAAPRASPPRPAPGAFDGSAAGLRAALAAGWLRALLSAAIGLGALWLAVRHVQPAQLWELLATVRWPGVALANAGLLGVIAIRVGRWRLLLAPFCRLDGWSLWRIGTIGLLMIFALPLRLGELVRPVLLARAHRVPVSTGLATIAVERVVDGLLVVLMFFAALRLAGATVVPRPAMVAAYLSLLLFAGAALVLLAARLWQPTVTGMMGRVVRPLSRGLAQRLVTIVDAFCLGVRDLSALGFARYVAASAAFWLLNALSYWALLLAFPFGQTAPLAAALCTVSVIVFAILIPGPPGFLGPFQLGIVVGLGIFGIGETEANAFGAIVYPLTAVLQFSAAAPFLILTPRSDAAPCALEQPAADQSPASPTST